MRPLKHTLGFAAACLLSLSTLHSTAQAASSRHSTELSGAGWNLWLDREASWKNDVLLFPRPSVSEVPLQSPTGGWEKLSGADTLQVKVPGTVEEYLQKRPGPEGDLQGVSWWSRKISIPADLGQKRVLLRLESARERVEVFVERQLVGYDIVGSTPLEFDITSAVQGRHTAELSVRVTDPGGNYDWRDSSPMRWGSHVLPMSHAFGGITGRVQLVICEPTYISDIYIQNTPALTQANVFVTLQNTTGAPQERSLSLQVREYKGEDKAVFDLPPLTLTLPPGESTRRIVISAPSARLWDLESPVLHDCVVRLEDSGREVDVDQKRFGFRWFAPENIGNKAIFRLNGKRIVLRTAISWGFWPINGIYPTEELAEKQVRTAKALGLNMLNFHRAIGNPVVLEKADELGLLYYEEPGAYKSVRDDDFGRKIVREKLLRMVKRDRSHPSLVIYNLINEWDSRNPAPDKEEVELNCRDMQAAHALDPSRVITHTSAWARAIGTEEPGKLHFRPFDEKPYWKGWYDVHHAGGPATWQEGMYRNPKDYYGYIENQPEIVFWGEEGALSTPPRLELIARDLKETQNLGWDADGYLAWARQFEEFIARKQLRSDFPSLDELTTAMGNISHYHQGRRIENMRLNDVADGYAINGWESELIENHSGIVDCFRNPKGDTRILAHYNQPLYVAVKLRNTVASPGTRVLADFFAINERNLAGEHLLRCQLVDASGKGLTSVEQKVQLTGGDVYGEKLAEALAFEIPANATGQCRLEAELLDSSGQVKATGFDSLCLVDWRSKAFASEGALWESGDKLARFLKNERSISVPAFGKQSGCLAWIIAARAPLEGEPLIVPKEVFSQSNGKPGLEMTIFATRRFGDPILTRTDAGIRFSVDDGAAPDPTLGVMQNYSVRWKGLLHPQLSGKHSFVLRTSGRARLRIEGKTVVDFPPPRVREPQRGSLELQAGKPVSIEVDYLAESGAAQCELAWVTPDTEPDTAQKIMAQVHDQGSTLIVLERADAWLELLAKQRDAKFRYQGSFRVGKTWLGGVHFARKHALFDGLPVPGALDWPFQSVVHNGEERLGLLVEGEELAAAAYHSFPMKLGTAVGILPFGRGCVIFSTLDIVDNLQPGTGPSEMAKHLLVNYLAVASERYSEAKKSGQSK